MLKTNSYELKAVCALYATLINNYTNMYISYLLLTLTKFQNSYLFLTTSLLETTSFLNSCLITYVLDTVSC